MTKAQCSKAYNHYLRRTYAPMSPADQLEIFMKAMYWLSRSQNAPSR